MPARQSPLAVAPELYFIMQFMFITLALFRRQDAVGHVVIEKLAHIIFAKEVATAALMRQAGPGIEADFASAGTAD